jgi:hypothetical protein
MEREWAPPCDPVFLLVPEGFRGHVETIYVDLGCPAVTSDTVWQVYADVLAAFRVLPRDLALVQDLRAIEDKQDGVDGIDLIPGLRDLPFGDGEIGDHGYYYMGGLAVPPPLDNVTEAAVGDDDREFAYFTPDEDDSS